MKFEDVQVKGVTFEVNVNTKGQFTTVVDCSVVTADSLSGLKEKLAKRLAKQSAKVSIPFCRWVDDDYGRKIGRMRTGAITGIHSSNSNLLIKWDDEERSEQDSHWHGQNYLDPDVKVEYEQLCKAAYWAKVAREEFEEKHQFNAREKVREELAKVVGDTTAKEVVE